VVDAGQVDALGVVVLVTALACAAACRGDKRPRCPWHGWQFSARPVHVGPIVGGLYGGRLVWRSTSATVATMRCWRAAIGLAAAAAGLLLERTCPRAWRSRR
jgi:hypothetical protein